MEAAIRELAEYYEEGRDEDRDVSRENGGFLTVSTEAFFAHLDWVDEFSAKHGKVAQRILRLNPGEVIKMARG